MKLGLYRPSQSSNSPHVVVIIMIKQKKKHTYLCNLRYCTKLCVLIGFTAHKHSGTDKDCKHPFIWRLCFIGIFFCCCCVWWCLFPHLNLKQFSKAPACKTEEYESSLSLFYFFFFSFLISPLFLFVPSSAPLQQTELILIYFVQYDIAMISHPSCLFNTFQMQEEKSTLYKKNKEK